MQQVELAHVLNSGHEVEIDICFDDKLAPMTTNNTGYKDLKQLHFMNYKYNILKSLERQNIQVTEKYTGKISISVVYFGRRRLDIDNYQKVLFDAITIRDPDCSKLLGNDVCLLKNDSQIVRMQSENMINKDYKNARIKMYIQHTDVGDDYFEEAEEDVIEMDERVKEYINICRKKAKCMKDIYGRRRSITSSHIYYKELEDERLRILNQI